MAVKTGYFQIPAGAIGALHIVTGLAFRPAGVFFLRWTNGNPPNAGPTYQTLNSGSGFMLENGKRGCISQYLVNGADPYTTESAIWNDAAIVVHGGAVTGKADFYSMEANGFVLISDQAFNTPITVFYKAISGVEFNALEITEPGAAGIVPYTGAGFPPTFEYILGSGKTAFNTVSADSQWCIGAASGPGAANNGVMARFELSNFGAADAAGYCIDTECLAIINASAVLAAAGLYSFDDDGISLNWFIRGSARKYLVVVATGRWHVENVLWPTNTNPFSETGMTWTLQGLAMFGEGVAKSTQDVVSPGAKVESVGMGTGPTERYLCLTAGTPDGTAGVSRITYFHRNDAIYGDIDRAAGAPVIDALGDINSAFVPNSFELVMDDAEPSAAFAWYFAVGLPVLEYRQRLTRYLHNTYVSRDEGHQIIRDAQGRDLPLEEIQVDNYLFSAAFMFPTPTKHHSNMEEIYLHYLETLSVQGDKLRAEVVRESLFDSVMRRLSG